MIFFYFIEILDGMLFGGKWVFESPKNVIAYDPPSSRSNGLVTGFASPRISKRRIGSKATLNGKNEDVGREIVWSAIIAKACYLPVLWLICFLLI